MKALDLANKKVFSTVLKLTLPAMLAQFVSVLYSIVDRMYVGNIEGTGDIALTALGVCAPVATLLTSFGNLVGLGGAPLFAMALGEDDMPKAKKILANALVMLLGLAVVTMTLTFALAKPLLMTFGASTATYSYARQYLLIYTAGTLFSVVSTGLNQFIIAQGYSGIGMATTLIGAVANIALDPLFIFTFNMGVGGAALATIISQFLSFVFVIVFLFLKGTKCRLSFGGYDVKTILRIFKMGISPFIIVATDSIIIIASNICLKAYGGDDADMWISSLTVVQAFLSIITMPMLGISTGSQPVISFNYGARNADLIKRGEKCILGMCIAFTSIMFALSFVVAKPFVSLFTDNERISQYSVWGIRIFMIGIIPLAFQYAFVDGMTAMGQPQFAIVLSLTRKLVLYLGATLLLPRLWGAQAVFYAEPIADIGAAVLSTTVFLIFFPKILKNRCNSDKVKTESSSNPNSSIDVAQDNPEQKENSSICETTSETENKNNVL